MESEGNLKTLLLPLDAGWLLSEYFRNKNWNSATCKLGHPSYSPPSACNKFMPLREGCQDQMLPKCKHCLNGGGSDPCLDFCEGFVHMHWGPSKVIIHHPEVIISKQKTVLKYNNNQFQFIEINYWPLQIFSEFSQQHVTCCWAVMYQMTMFTPD